MTTDKRDGGELLPLPGLPNIGAGGQWEGWSDDDMQAYARANVERALAESREEVSGLRAARMAYASEFPLNDEGEPDVGNIHANIRALKARAERLAGALLKFGQHLDECRVSVTQPCTCGFDAALADQETT